MRVAVDATSLLGSPTGVGVFTREIVHRIADRPGLDLRLFSVTWRGRGALAASAPPGARVSPVPFPARLARAAWRHVDLPWAALLAGRGGLDVVHGPNFVVPPGGLRRGRGAAELVTIHDLTPLRYPELCTADTLEYPELIRRALRRGAHVHAVSQAVADEVVDAFSLRADRVTVVHNGVQTRPAPVPDAGAVSLPSPLDDGRRYVLALGTIEPRKDLPTLVRAFGHLAHDPAGADVDLVLAGGDGWGVAALDEALTSLGARHPNLRTRIHRTGWIDDETRNALLRGAAALAYPSRYEGFGLPPLEALAVGTPVVATDLPALREVLGEAALLSPVGDAESLAGALATTLAGGPEGDRRLAAGAARVAELTWDRTADGIVELYRHLAGT